MAGIKISQLPSATVPMSGAELLEVVQSGVSSKVAASAIANSATAVAYASLSGRAYIQALSLVDQTGSTSAATAITFNSGLTGTGISVVSSSRITFAAAGTYAILPSIQFANSNTSDHTATVWFRKNGTDIANSATIISVPKAADGGVSVFSIAFYDTVTAGQYIEIMWLPDNTAVSIDYRVAGAIAPAVPSVICPAERIA